MRASTSWVTLIAVMYVWMDVWSYAYMDLSMMRQIYLYIYLVKKNKVKWKVNMYLMDVDI